MICPFRDCVFSLDSTPEVCGGPMGDYNCLGGLQERRLGSCGKPLICHSGDFPELVRPRKDFLFKDQEKIRRIYFWNTEISPLAVSFPEGARPWKSMEINENVSFKKNRFMAYMYTSLRILNTMSCFKFLS